MVKSFQDKETELNTQLADRDEEVKEQANEIEELKDKLRRKTEEVKEEQIK